jgi:hypothetical protein
MKTAFRVALPCALALSFAAGAVQAQNFGPPEQRETWMESSRTQVWRNGFGECWHSAFGPPPPPSACGPAVAQYVPPPAPRAAPPPPAPVVAPAPAPVVEPAPLPPRKTRG